MSTNKETTLEREMHAWKQYMRGVTQEAIAKELGISQPAVAKILNRVRTRLAEQWQADGAELLAEQISRLSLIVEEAMAAWQASKLQPQPVPTEEHSRIGSPASNLVFASTPDPDAPTAENGSFPDPAPRVEAATVAAAEGQGKPVYLRIATQAVKALTAAWQLLDNKRAVTEKEQAANAPAPEPFDDRMTYEVDENDNIIPCFAFDEKGKMVNLMTGKPMTAWEAEHYGF